MLSKGNEIPVLGSIRKKWKLSTRDIAQQRKWTRENIFLTLGIIGENVKQIFAFFVLCVRLLISILAINVCSFSLLRQKAILIIVWITVRELKYMNLRQWEQTSSETSSRHLQTNLEKIFYSSLHGKPKMRRPKTNTSARRKTILPYEISRSYFY